MKDTLLAFIRKNFTAKEPILYEDLKSFGGKASALRVQLKRLNDRGDLLRVSRGVYCLPAISKITTRKVSSSLEDVLEKKYIAGGKGYFSGLTFSNRIGATSQVPMVYEIRTNKATTAYREIKLLGQRILLRQPRTKVTKENIKILQLLDFLTDLKQINEWSPQQLRAKVHSLMKQENIERTMIEKYIRFYPDSLFRNIYETGLF